MASLLVKNNPKMVKHLFLQEEAIRVNLYN